ncbi:MAG: hypothetical protein Q8O34_00010 [Rhodocyclaceae bacterium]|nr:hypothetical protein [Rhodocyclaceae bacterium]
MKFTVSDLKQDRQWRSAIGMSQEQFKILSGLFEKSYVDRYKARLSARKVEANIDYCIANEEELLLFTLFSLKSGLTYDVLGIVCGMNGSNAKRNQNIGLETLKKTLDQLGHMPKRKLLTVNGFEGLFKNETDLIIDATEQRIQRPGNNEGQKETYSGKKKPIP